MSKTFWNNIRSFILLLLPESRMEKMIFIGCMILYFSIGMYILNASSIIYSPLTDVYFGFDAAKVYHEGSTSVFKHPLMLYITKPLLYIGNLLTYIHPLLKGVLFILILNTMISLSVIYVFRYLRNIIELSTKCAVIFILFFATCNTCLYLSFTSESYPFSIFLLSFTIWYFSDSIKRSINIGTFPILTLSVLTGGITITNASKVIMSSLFLKDRVNTHIYRIVIISFFLILICLFGIFNTSKNQGSPVNYTVMTDNFEGYSLMEKTVYGSTFRKVSDQFLGSPIFMPQFTLREAEGHIVNNTTSDIKQTQIKIDFYSNYLQLIVLLSFYCFIVYFCWINRRNKFIWMILAIVSVDVFIHIIKGYALNEAFIFSGHWVFILPLIIGWGIKKMNKIQLKITIPIIGVLAILFLLNNSIRFVQFAQLVKVHYPPILE